MKCVCCEHEGIRRTNGHIVCDTCANGLNLKAKPIIEIKLNGDPYGAGYTGSQSDDGGRSWYYRGDVGAQYRRWWRAYCQNQGYILRYAL